MTAPLIDREKVTAAIDECLKTDEFQCEKCPYLGKQADVLACVGALMKDASELLKTDQYYLQKLTERLQLIADIAYDYDGYRASKQLMELIDEMRDIAIRGLPEVKND